MADLRVLKERMEALGDRLAADPATSPDFLRFLLAVKGYQAALAEQQAADMTEVARAASVPRHTRLSAGAVDPKREAILGASRKVLVDLGSREPVKTSAIFAALPEEIAKTVPGKEPRYNLSAILHNSKRFVSHGRMGWTLPEAMSGADMGLGRHQEEDEYEDH
jgi:hypothetical protein